jgi:amino acid adenylation domain-containing protein
MQQDAVVSEFGAGIAIVGMSCILPGGVRSPQALWEFLCEGRDGISEVPADRWNNAAVFDPDPGKPGKTPTKWGGFVKDIAEFDAAFFGISPREAAVMDPQQRMLLETAWRALEDAGVQIDKLPGTDTGVFIGISHSDYHGIQKFGRPDIDVHTSTGGALSIAANRLSHRFDLRGPSLSVDTACSSSLVALDLACQAIRNGACEMALCGGVNAILTPDVTVTFSRASMLSPDGRCKAFDSRANGYVRGEGAGMVVLKPVTRAIADGDRIHAIIRATAVNQDGRTTTITVPSMDAQMAMLREACRRAAIAPLQVNYVEAHGTGTAVGDPIEAEAIGRVFGKSSGKNKTCVIGSIKSNIGHLEPAAGIVGLIKAALCVENGQVPSNLHFQKPNPNIRFEELGIRVNNSLAPFPGDGATRLAAVNSFGFGGTNACAILQQPPTRLPVQGTQTIEGDFPLALPLSAPSRASLEALAGDFAATLESGKAALADVAGTLALRHSHLEHGVVVLADSVEQAAASFRAFEHKEPRAGVVSGRRGERARTAFVFTGQGAHWWAMGRGLLKGDPVFRRKVEECNEIFRGLSGWSLLNELLATQERSRVDQTFVTQPTTFALQVALAARWKAWGIEPEATIGHSIGEMAAMHVAGAISLEDGVKVVYHRSRLQEQSRLLGGMAAIGLSADETQKLLDQMQIDLEVAAVNGPELVAVAGRRSEAERLVEELKLARSDVFARLLHIDYAFHSKQMDPFETELRASLKAMTSREPAVPAYSTVTGKLIEAGELDADYWWRNMRNPVLFRQAAEAAIGDGFNTFVELGAHPVLTGPVRACLAHCGREGTVVGSLHREEKDRDYISRSLADLHLAGVAVDWARVAPPNWNFVELPRQRFERKTFWSESEESRTARFSAPVHPLLGYRLGSAVPSWQAHISAEAPSYLVDHVVNGSAVFPAAGYVELMLAAARETLPDQAWELEEIAFHDALILSEDAIQFVQTSVDTGRGIVEIKSRMRNEDGDWVLRASGRLRAWSGAEPKLKPWTPEIEPPAHFERTRFYRELRAEGHEFGPAFQGVETIWRERGQVLGRIGLPQAAGTCSDYLLHPSVLDSCFQVIRGFRDFDQKEEHSHTLALPIAIRRLRFFRKPGAAMFSRAVAAEEDDGENIIADISIIDEAGRLVALIEGFTCRQVTQPAQQQTASGPAHYQEQWVALPAPEAAEVEGRPEGSWLILADRGGIGDALAGRLAQQGIKAVRAIAAAEFRRRDDDNFECAPDADCFAKLLEALSPAGISRIAHLWALDGSDVAVSAARIAEAQKLGSEALIALAKAAATAALPVQLVTVTRGTAAVGEAARGEQSMLHAGIPGVARTIGNEFPDFKPLVIDLDPVDRTADALATELLGAAGETEIALRGTRRFGVRLERVPDEALPKRRIAWDLANRSPEFRLTMSSAGVIDNLLLRETPARIAGEGEVLVEVHAVGLNFRDVMAATGLLPAEAEVGPAWERLGFECAGIVRQVGAGVDPALLGKRVVAVTSGAFASQVAVSAALVFEIPKKFTFAQASAIPTAYATAQYALATLGRIQKGEKVLIHAATGGVGLAAISVARRHGAEIYATAGSDEKRAYLRKLGVQHIFDSRSLDFADGVLAATNGYGVDLVLNSLPGPFLEKGLNLLASGGRFLEIGKRDIYADTPIGLRALRKNVSFFAIDLARLAEERPDRLRNELESVLSDLGRGRLDPLPVENFPLSQVADAFRHMAKARHIGKIVVSYDAPAPQIETIGGVAQIVRSDATYLVTGGLRGFGLATAKWLVDLGARNLVLVSRSGEAPAEELDVMRAAGAQIVAVAADVATREGVAAALGRVAELGVPLRGVIHAAGVIDDALVAQLELDRIRRVFEPKVLGAWHLHELTRDAPLDFFVAYSSVAAHLGSMGQAHYAGANRSLEALAELRRAQGLPALTVAWGAIGETGFLAHHADVARFLSQSGVSLIPVKEALTGLGELLTRDCASVVYADVRWPTLSRANPMLAGVPRVAGLIGDGQDENRGGQHLRAKILATDEEARPPIVIQFLREQIAAVLKVTPASVELDRPLSDIGLDSLTSFELKNRVEAQLGIALAIGSFLQKPTAQDITKAILDKIDSSAADSSTTASTGGDSSGPVMSIGQEALWFVEHFAPGSPAYGLAMCISVRPHVDTEQLGNAFQQVVARHDSLTVSFPADANGPVPTALDPSEFKVRFEDMTAWSEGAVRAEIDREANRPFDLGAGPLVRLHHFRRADDDVVLLHVHHIVADATSIAIMVEQMLEAYFALRAGAQVRWSAPARSYANFVNWQNSVSSGATGAGHLAFWSEELAGAPIGTTLPTDYPRPQNQRGPGASRKISIPSLLSRQLIDTAQEQGTTLFSLLLSAFNVLLHDLTGEADFVVGVPVGGRIKPEFEDSVGYLVNPVPIRTRLDPAQSFKALLGSVDERVRNALEHQEYPFARIVRELQLTRDPRRSPVFQVMFAMERSASLDSNGFAVTLLNTEGAGLNVREFRIEALAAKRDRAQFELTFLLEEFGGEIYGVVDYRTDLWDAETIDRFVARYEAILQGVSRSVEASIPDVAPRPGPARAITGPVLADYPDVCDAIRQAAADNPDEIAVEGVDGGQTYRVMMQRIDAIAAALALREVGPGALVGVCMSRSGALVNAMLGVLETGAAYLPLDLSHPPARLGQILADAAPKLMIADEKSAAAVRAFAGCPVITVETLMQFAPRSAIERKKGDLAYVLHTSGSTGKPVGVEVLRGGLSNFMAAMAAELSLTPTDTLLAVTTIAFDIAGLELLLPLTLGGRVVVADEDMLRDPRRLAARLDQGDITAMQATPATWQTLLDAGWDGARDFTALVGGERLPRALADAVAARVDTLWNLYGPTETTIWSTAAQVTADGGSVPIGRPIANTLCYIVDENLQCVPEGVPGELLIGGQGVARGYLNDPERTAARFVADPLDPNGALCFRTGDFVRRGHDGALVYLGRRDQQVKIRGFRVELGEIEARLGAHPSVRAAAAVVHGSNLADARIGAYVVLEQGAVADPQGLVAHLKEALPSYMVPANVAIVEALPRLPNGKIDRERLVAGAVALAGKREARVAPRNPVEEKLLAVLKDVIGSDDVGVEDNFFEAGGTSLLGMRYLARVSDVLNVELGPADLMRAASVVSLAECIAEKTAAAANTAALADGAAVATGHSYWRPLPLVRAESGLARVDAAAIAYLPDEIVSSPLFRAQFAARKDDALPFWTGVGHLSTGSIALVVVPSGAREFFADPDKARTSIDQAVAYAGRLGAQTISLTGLIPAVTDLGRALSGDSGAALTTGHAATASAMGLTLQSVLSSARRNIRKERLCFVGLGAIGTATLRTVLGCIDHPEQITLCDVVAKRAELEKLAQEAKSVFGFRGDVRVLTTTGSLPREAYDADVFVGATNVPNVIAVEQLRPGAIIVDDSFPLCFDLATALRRFRQAGDILFVSGGSVQVPGGVKWDIALPPAIPGFARSRIASALLPSERMITGCILSALLPQANGLKPTIGEASLDDCRAYFAAFATMGITAAPLHCGAWFPSADDVDRFRAAAVQSSATAAE